MYSFPNQKTSTKSEKRLKRKVVPKASLPLVPKEVKHTTETLGQLFDRFTVEQRHDVDLYTTGYLNPQMVNQKLKEERDKKKKTEYFGNNVKESTLSPGETFDLLEKFDSVKMRKEANDFVGKEAESAQIRVHRKLAEVKKPTRSFYPSTHFTITKRDQYKTLAMVDSNLVQDGRDLRHNDIGKQVKLQQYRNFIEDELLAANCPAQGPDLKRLQIFSECFERVIEDFAAYGGLLADIKSEYDRTVSSFKAKDEEFIFLRTKVQKLLSQNENRMMLKYEKQKCRGLEDKIGSLELDNSKLKEEMVYKLSVYSAYLPRSILAEQKKHSSLDERMIKFEYGKDPLSERDRTIVERDKAIAEKTVEVEELRRAQTEDFVPRVTKEKLEENFKILEEKSKRYQEQNSLLESSVHIKKETIKNLENLLRDKEQEYQFLVSEYSELSEVLSKRKSIDPTPVPEQQ